MKALLALSLLVGAAPALARDATDICRIMNSRGYYDDANSCLDRASGTFSVSAAAGQICSQMSSRGYHQKAMECVSAVSRGRFDSRLVSLCTTMSNRGYYDDAIRCLRTIEGREAGPAVDLCETQISRGYYSRNWSLTLWMA